MQVFVNLKEYVVNRAGKGDSFVSDVEEHSHRFPDHTSLSCAHHRHLEFLIRTTWWRGFWRSRWHEDINKRSWKKFHFVCIFKAGNLRRERKAFYGNSCTRSDVCNKMNWIWRLWKSRSITKKICKQRTSKGTPKFINILRGYTLSSNYWRYKLPKTHYFVVAIHFGTS